jgi:DNA-binding transcriptional LysR family regulator
MSLKIEMLRCFCAVAKAGNLAEAADQLGRTQSAVSMTLKQLEAHLNAPLFEGERKNRLTRLGEQVLTLSLGQIRQFDSTVQAIEASARAPQGILRIAAVPSVAALTFPQVVRHMSDRYPGLRIELRDTDSQQVMDALVQGQADLGLASADQAIGGVRSELLFEDSYGVILSAADPLADPDRPIAIRDLFQRPFLRNALCERIRTPEFAEELGAANVVVHNTQSLLAMVRTGDWVTVLPQSVIRFARDGLIFRPVNGLSDQRQVYLHLREQDPLPAYVQEAHAFVKSMIQTEPTPPVAAPAR